MRRDQEQILKNICSKMTDEFMIRKDFRESAEKEFGYKRVTVNWALKQLINGGFVEQVLDEKGDTMVRRTKEFDGINTKEAKVVELKKAPEERVRKTLTISEQDASGLGLLTLRTPPVKENLVYPEGVTKEMFDEFKRIIIENAELLKDLITNFNGAKGTAITMWNPEDKKANEFGKVFYRWDEPVESWELMTQLCKVVELYNAQESAKVEEE